jgi:osmotically-inducible protein OsmY
MGAMNIPKIDRDIQQAVLDEIAWDTRVSPAHVAVEVDNSIVTLTGTAPSLAKKLAAEDAAHRVAGVRDVANDIAVGVAPGAVQPTDTEIAGAIRQALLWDVFVPEAQIHTSVSNGVVTLRGRVETLVQRHDAARAIGSLAGVLAVDNLITVERPQISPTVVRAAIFQALERRAQREVDRIDLDVSDGKVTVSGMVHSWTEREAVIGAVRGTRGVDTVVDELLITG